MLLGEILHRDAIKLGLDATEKFQAIEELVDWLVQAGEVPLTLRDHVLEAVHARERSMSTGMEDGVALPHGTSTHLPSLVAAMGISKAGIDFECLDGKLAHIVLMLVLPRDQFQVHVRTLAGISHLLNQAPLRKALIQAESVDAIIATISVEEQQSLFDRFRKRLR